MKIDTCEKDMPPTLFIRTPESPIKAGLLSAPMPRVPVMPATLLSLEMLLHYPSLDLRKVSRLLREDPGALLHLFAVVAEEGAALSDPPARIENYIASLPLERLLKRLVTAGSPHRDHTSLSTFALHAVTIGFHAQQVAASLDLPGEQAMLVGTLHELGFLPWALGWQAMPGTAGQAATCCEQLCLQYSLPVWLSAALIALHRHASDSMWTAISAAAHELAEQRLIFA